MRLKIDVRGHEAARQHIEGYGGRARNLRPGFELVAHQLMAAEAALFATEGRGQWRRLDPDTLRQRGDHRILRLTGTLERSLTRRGARGQDLHISSDTLRFGTKLPYARFQKPRKLIDLTPADRRSMVNTLRRYLLGP